MKNRFKTFCAAVLAVASLAVALPATAQTPVMPKVYPLTNATTFTLATGGTNLATAALTLINSAPFPVWRGRGFTVNLSIIGTNSGTAAVTPFFQFATPVYSNGVLVTNWSSAYTPGGGATQNGTTRVYSWGLVPPTTVDNVALGRLAVVSNAHSASILLDSTNTFISVIP